MYQRIKDLREDSDLPQREVARLLSMSQTGYSKIRDGRERRAYRRSNKAVADI